MKKKEDFKKKKTKKPPTIKEARRYVDNANEILRERGKLDKDGIEYEDEKYVRAAGNYLWLGVLMALDTVFHVRDDRRTRVHIGDYFEVIAKRDGKLLDWVDSAYGIIHCYMNYDGNASKKLCDSGFEYATRIIDRCEAMVPSALPE